MSQDSAPLDTDGRAVDAWSKLGGIVPRAFADIRLVETERDYLAESLIGRNPGRVSEIAALVLACCDGSKTLLELVESFESAYPDAADQVRRDVVDTVRRLYSLHLVTLCGARPDGSGEHLPATFHENRGGIVSSILERRGWRPAPEDGIAELSLWHPRPGPRVGRLQCYELHITHALRCKRKLALNLQAAGCEWIGPDTCPDIGTFLQRDDQDALWFVKLSRSTEGRDVFCYRDRRLVEERVAAFGHEVYVIQRGVEDPLLIDGRKTTLRVYVVAANGALWLHGEALHKTQRERYREDATEAAVQSDHSGAERRSSDDLPLFEAQFDGIAERVTSAFAAVSDSFDIHPDPCRFQIFGLDFVVSRSRGPMLLEVNDWPNIAAPGSGDDRERTRALRERVLTDTLDLVLEGRPGRLVKILEPFAQGSGHDRSS